MPLPATAQLPAFTIDEAVGAAYLYIRRGRVAATREIVEAALVADYDAGGALLGIELLAPVPRQALLDAIDEQTRDDVLRILASDPLRRFFSDVQAA